MQRKASLTMTKALGKMPCQVWRLGNSSAPRAHWTPEYLYFISPESQELLKLTKAQTRRLFVRLQGLYRD